MKEYGRYDLVVAGGGPAGVSAAIAAGRRGSRVLLIEMSGSLGGVWTSGLLSYVLDVANKGGFLAELTARLREQNDYLLVPHPRSEEYDGSGDFTYDSEGMKYLLEDLCTEAGVEVLLYTRVVAADVVGDRVSAAIVENYDGRGRVEGELFLDCTGNGEFAARAGVEYETGHPETGRTQPATLIAVITGFPPDYPNTNRGELKRRLFAELEEVGAAPSYRSPLFVHLPNPVLGCLAINHEYDVPCDDTRAITAATMRARREVYRAVAALRRNVAWKNARVAATAPYLGLREGRRLKGRYTVSANDITAGRKFDDGICLVGLPVDIHGLAAKDEAVARGGLVTRPYHIPLRSLISNRYENLGFAGRCIDGDFYAHASYRVTGNAVPMGEAAGTAAAIACAGSVGSAPNFGDAPAESVRDALRDAGHVL